jgi:hypothetical protein
MADANEHGYGAWHMSALFFFGEVGVVAAPFWLILFLPLYLSLSAKSVLWRWYVTPFVGAVIGAPVSYFLFSSLWGHGNNYPSVILAPVLVGICTGLSGAILKALEPESAV